MSSLVHSYRHNIDINFIIYILYPSYGCNFMGFTYKFNAVFLCGQQLLNEVEDYLTQTVVSCSCVDRADYHVVGQMADCLKSGSRSGRRGNVLKKNLSVSLARVVYDTEKLN